MGHGCEEKNASPSYLSIYKTFLIIHCQTIAILAFLEIIGDQPLVKQK